MTLSAVAAPAACLASASAPSGSACSSAWASALGALASAAGTVWLVALVASAAGPLASPAGAVSPAGPMASPAAFASGALLSAPTGVGAFASGVGAALTASTLAGVGAGAAPAGLGAGAASTGAAPAGAVTAGAGAGAALALAAAFCSVPGGAGAACCSDAGAGAAAASPPPPPPPPALPPASSLVLGQLDGLGFDRRDCLFGHLPVGQRLGRLRHQVRRGLLRSGRFLESESLLGLLISSLALDTLGRYTTGLLDSVGQLVGQQVPTALRARLVLTSIKRDVRTDRKRPRVQRARRRGGVVIGVDTDLAEIVPKAVLEEAALARRQRLAAALHSADITFDLG